MEFRKKADELAAKVCGEGGVLLAVKNRFGDISTQCACSEEHAALVIESSENAMLYEDYLRKQAGKDQGAAPSDASPEDEKSTGRKRKSKDQGAAPSDDDIPESFVPAE